MQHFLIVNYSQFYKVWKPHFETPLKSIYDFENDCRNKKFTSRHKSEA